MYEGGGYVCVYVTDWEGSRESDPLLACVVDLWFLKYQIIWKLNLLKLCIIINNKYCMVNNGF